MNQNLANILAYLITQAGMSLGDTPRNYIEFSRLRPHHGFHLGLLRLRRTPYNHEYVNEWLAYKTNAKPIIQHPLFNQLQQLIESDIVKQQLQQLKTFILDVSGDEQPQLTPSRSVVAHNIYKPAKPTISAGGKIVMAATSFKEQRAKRLAKLETIRQTRIVAAQQGLFVKRLGQR